MRSVLRNLSYVAKEGMHWNGLIAQAAGCIKLGCYQCCYGYESEIEGLEMHPTDKLDPYWPNLTDQVSARYHR